MTTYADPTRCPDCRAALPPHPQTCRVCSLPLRGETVVSLFSTLQEADRLLGELRSQKRPVVATVGAATTAPSPGSLLVQADRYPAPGHRPAHPVERPRLRGSSVPKILLSLGALCLLVAAVIFLAVAWSWLGVGGRTGVLVALTGTALGVAVALHRRGLHLAAEALCVVGLGLLGMDVLGVDRAGWLGTGGGGHLALLPGTVVGAGALLMLVATSRRPLVAPGVIAPLAVLAAGIGALLDSSTLAPLVVTVAVLLALGRLGTVLSSRPLQVSSAVVAALGWGGLLLAAWSDLESLPVTLDHYVRDGAGWPFLAATLLAAAVGPVTGMRRLRGTGYALAGTTGSYAVLYPVLDNAPTSMVASVLATAVIWVVVLAVAPRSLRPVALVPLAGTLVVPVVAAFGLAGDAARSVASVGPAFSRSYDVHVHLAATWVTPLLLAPTLVAAAAAVCAARSLVRPMCRETWAMTLGVAGVLGALGAVPLYDVPLAVVVGLLVAAGAGALLVAERLSGTAADLTRCGALLLITVAAVGALPSDRLTAAVLVAACAATSWLTRRTDAIGCVAATLFPIAFAGLLWAGANVADVDPELRAVPVLLVLGALAIWRPRVELEVSVALVCIVVSTVAVGMADDVGTACAVHLTIAGVLVTATSMINPSRRGLAWVGSLLLVIDTWVRLHDLGVHLPEAYTLPSALVLIGVGVWRLRQDDRSATLIYLCPGLTLATVPSLVAILDDPASLRALLLGAACLGLVLGAVAYRWSAPLVVGAVVGTLLVLRELAPYTASVPTWLTIGVSGAVLLGVGITWESRMCDLQRATRYVAALR